MTVRISVAETATAQRYLRTEQLCEICGGECDPQCEADRCEFGYQYDPPELAWLPVPELPIVRDPDGCMVDGKMLYNRPLRVGDEVILTAPCPEPMCRGGYVQYPEWEGRDERCRNCDDGRVDVVAATVHQIVPVVYGFTSQNPACDRFIFRSAPDEPGFGWLRTRDPMTTECLSGDWSSARFGLHLTNTRQADT